MLFNRVFFCFLLFTLIFPYAANCALVYDRAHGQKAFKSELTSITQALGITLQENLEPIDKARLKNTTVLYLKSPTTAFSETERDAIVQYLHEGGSMLLVLDEERRQSLQTTQVNTLLTPFSMMLTADTPYLHNAGAQAVASAISQESRSLPFSGGRAIVGGTPFAYQLDKNGELGFPFAAYKVTKNGGRIVVMSDAMAAIFMGEKDAVRLTGKHRDPRNTRYWGEDSYVFMKEVIDWLTKTNSP